MSQVIPEEIGHLDFEVNDEDSHHFTHPTDPKLCWCGKPATTRDTFTESRGKETVSADKIDCVTCLQLYIKFGGTWWWDTHRRQYGSSCGAWPKIHHDCE